MNWKLAKGVCAEVTGRLTVGTFKRLASPEVDSIFLQLLQRGTEIILGSLLRMVRSSTELRYIPRAGRRAIVVFVPKAGKNIRG